MNHNQLSFFKLSLLSAVLSLGVVNTASAAANAPASAPVTKAGAGLELGVHGNAMVFVDPLDINDQAINDFDPVLGYTVLHVAYAFKLNRAIDIVPELNVGFGTYDHEYKESIRYSYGSSSKTKITTTSSSIIKVGAQFRLNSGRVFSTYVGPEFVKTKIKMQAEGSSKSTSKSYSKFGGMLGMGFTIASHFMLDFRIDAVSDVIGLDAGFVYKF